MPDKSQSRDVQFYNLDVIISVGYRVKSHQGTQFRIWATQRLREYIVKGFALNDERFKAGNSMAYFTELQERIREIRLSERFFYQKIKDIYTTSSEAAICPDQARFAWSTRIGIPLRYIAPLSRCLYPCRDVVDLQNSHFAIPCFTAKYAE